MEEMFYQSLYASKKTLIIKKRHIWRSILKDRGDNLTSAETMQVETMEI